MVKKNNKDITSKLEQISISDLEKINITDVKENKKPIKTFSFLKFIYNIPLNINYFLKYSIKPILYSLLASLIGFVFAIVLFPENPGIFSVFFITLFLATYVIKEVNINTILFGRSKKIEKDGVSLIVLKPKDSSKNKFQLNNFYEENKKIILMYLFFFLGIMFFVITLICVLPTQKSEQLFTNQGWAESLTPAREFGFENFNKLNVFIDILKNNLSVMLISFLIALIFPLGALFIIVWNAIYWAVSFTQFSIFYGQVHEIGLTSILLPLLLSVALHTILEATSYFIAAIAGTILAISLRKDLQDIEITYIIKYCLILIGFALLFLLVGVFSEVYIFDILKRFFFMFF